jgi:hypothetical protein
MSEKHDLVAKHWGAICDELGLSAPDGPTCPECSDELDDNNGQLSCVDSECAWTGTLADANDSDPGPDWQTYDADTFDRDGQEWLVLTDEEADARCRERIEESLWAFNPSFLAGETGIDEDVFKAIAANDKCEGNNTAIRSIIKGSCGLDDFVANAAGADGRGHFLSSYDSEEREVTVGDELLYFYRTN